MQYYLDQEERGLLDSYEAGEWHSVNEIRTEVERYKEYARATFKKDRRVNIALSSKPWKSRRRRASVHNARPGAKRS
jgi:predicted DNA binding CopG/RHH family protein